jgi:hypothetical protein
MRVQIAAEPDPRRAPSGRRWLGFGALLAVLLLALAAGFGGYVSLARDPVSVGPYVLIGPGAGTVSKRVVIGWSLYVLNSMDLLEGHPRHTAVILLPPAGPRTGRGFRWVLPGPRVIHARRVTQWGGFTVVERE